MTHIVLISLMVAAYSALSSFWQAVALQAALGLVASLIMACSALFMEERIAIDFIIITLGVTFTVMGAGIAGQLLRHATLILLAYWLRNRP